MSYTLHPRTTPARPLRRNAHAQALFDAKARGAYVPDVELVWFDRVDIANGCKPNTALLFPFEMH